MATLASLSPAFLALAVCLVAAWIPTATASLLPRWTLGLYTSLMLPAVAIALALLHLHSDYPHHALPCLPLALLAVMTVLASGFVAGFAWQQHQIQKHLLPWCLPAPEAVRAVVIDLAGRLEVDPPAVELLEIDRPVALTVGVLTQRIYLSRWFLDALSATELEGVLAHELAHAVRRDNLLALLSAACLGATACLPPGRWAFNMLMSERELAADELAAALTHRPLSLARGLLKASANEPLPLGLASSSLGGSLDQRLKNLLRLSRLEMPAPLHLHANESRWLFWTTLGVPAALGWLIFALPHLLKLP